MYIYNLDLIRITNELTVNRSLLKNVFLDGPMFLQFDRSLVRHRLPLINRMVVKSKPKLTLLFAPKVSFRSSKWQKKGTTEREAWKYILSRGNRGCTCAESPLIVAALWLGRFPRRRSSPE